LTSRWIDTRISVGFVPFLAMAAVPFFHFTAEIEKRQ
jgi:hypothetical protein